MDLEPTAEHAAFREELRSFIDENLPPPVRRKMHIGMRPTKQETIDWQRQLHAKGWAAPHWPKAYGGADLGLAERIILLEELQRAPAPLPLTFNTNLLGPVILKFGTPEQKADWLPRLARLDVWFAQGFSEPGAGSDLASLRTSARREDGRYIVNGQKIWTSYAHLADWIFCLVRTDPDAARKQDGISFLLIDLRSKGITVRPIVSIDNDHHLNEVFFDDVEVPIANLVHAENRGWDVAKFLLGNERSGIAAVGTSRDRLARAMELAAATSEAGRRLIDDPQLLSEFAWIDAELRGLEITNLRLLLSPRAQLDNPAFASVLKLKGSELQQQIAALSMRIAGPLGLVANTTVGIEAPETEEASLASARYFFSRATTIYGGASEVQKDILAKALME